MKNTNITEINMDLLEKVTGGTIGTCDPAIGDKVTSCDPPKAVGPVNVVGPVKAVGPVEYPFKAMGAF